MVQLGRCCSFEFVLHLLRKLEHLRLCMHLKRKVQGIFDMGQMDEARDLLLLLTSIRDLKFSMPVVKSS